MGYYSSLKPNLFFSVNVTHLSFFIRANPRYGHFMKNVRYSVHDARRMSAWYDGMPLIPMATDLSHEIEAKCIPVHISIFTIFQLSIMHSVCPKLLLWNTPGRSAYFQEHSATTVYAKFGGQTECIIGNWKIRMASETILVEKAPR